MWLPKNGACRHLQGACQLAFHTAAPPTQSHTDAHAPLRHEQVCGVYARQRRHRLVVGLRRHAAHGIKAVEQGGVRLGVGRMLEGKGRQQAAVQEWRSRTSHALHFQQPKIGAAATHVSCCTVCRRT